MLQFWQLLVRSSGIMIIVLVCQISEDASTATHVHNTLGALAIVCMWRQMLSMRGAMIGLCNVL